ncbi:MAG: 2TM domain-containing protein [Promethearchaeota archaeon]|nr:MAG: 2TM domain-containing protein [Candidatus Lokiarchaeota archaeon]
MSEELEFSEESLRRIAAQKVIFRFSVKIHAIAYILVNILLFFINAIFTPNVWELSTWWALYPALGWLVGLAIHITAYMLYAGGYGYETRGILFNFVAYLFSMLLLAVIDYMTSPAFEWFFYPALFWGVGIIVHIIISSWITRNQRGSEGKLSRKERAIEQELQRMKNRMKREEDV